MALVVGVAFKRVARSYWFAPGDLDLKQGDRVVVETTRGVEIGFVRVPPREIEDAALQAPLKRVYRVATADDLRQEERNLAKVDRAVSVATERIRAHELPMRVLLAEYVFDGSQVTIYFSAENRVDFRDLVKDLAGLLRCKVQLYQVGARDQAKIVGGVGSCGLCLCCSTFLTEFAPVSMKMAKDQSLFLNPVKFSGVCGKLMCCLRYEHEQYVETRRRLPQIGQTVTTPRGPGRILDVNVVTDEVVVFLQESQVELRFPAADVTRVPKEAPCMQATNEAPSNGQTEPPGTDK